jgi:hypothetical protein
MKYKVYTIITNKGSFDFVSDSEENAITTFRKLNGELAIEDIIETKLTSW